MALGDPVPFGMFIHDKEIVVGIPTGEEEYGVMGEAVIHASDPLDDLVLVEILDDMDVVAECVEELAGGDVPITIAPGLPLPAGALVENGLVFRVDELVILHAGGDKASGGLGAVLIRQDESLVIPIVADAAGIGGGIEARPPAGLGRTKTGADVLVFTLGESGGLLDTNDVVFDAEKGVYILFVLVMADDDARAVFEGEDAPGGIVRVLEGGENTLA